MHRPFLRPITQWLRALGVAAAGLALVAGALVVLPSLAAASTTTVSFSYTGSAQSWTVPAGVSSITVDMDGGAGAGYPTLGPGGSGGRVQGSVVVSPGEVLEVYVGGEGEFFAGGVNGSSGEYGGGSGAAGRGNGDGAGGGGAASALVIASGTPLAIAAGGGGGTEYAGVDGGADGGLTGGAGGGGYLGGAGGTQSSGGAGNGNGGAGAICAQNDCSGGGGGGGGYYGGNGGGNDPGDNTDGGGGGGSSLVPAGGTTTAGYESGNGYVDITYTPATAPAITSASSTTFTGGEASSFTFSATGNPAPSFSESGTLPKGVTLGSSGVLSGTPEQDGTFPIVVTAANGVSPDATQDFTLLVTPGDLVADTGTGNAAATLSSGVLSFVSAPGNLAFPAVDLDGVDQMTSASLGIGISDGTGSGAGWALDATSTTFSNGTSQLPADAVTVDTAPSVACDTGATCTLATDAVPYPYALPAGASAPAATTLYSAAVGTGMGDQTVTPVFSLAVPANAAAGAYSATWTFSLVSGP